MKNLIMLANSVVSSANEKRDSDISVAKAAVIADVKETVIAEVIADKLDGADLTDLATKSDVAAATDTVTTALNEAVDTLNQTISGNKTDIETTFSQYTDTMATTISDIRDSISANTQKITANEGGIYDLGTEVTQAKADIDTNAKSIARVDDSVKTLSEEVYKKTDVYTKAEVAELLGNAAGVQEVIGTYTKDQIDELLAQEMDVDNAYTKGTVDTLLLAKVDTDTFKGATDRIDALESKMDAAESNIGANYTIATGAKSVADDASSVAKEASDTAVAASNTATAASDTAVAAKGIAEEASDTAVAALSHAATATDTAAAAVSTANTAKETADQTASDLTDLKTAYDEHVSASQASNIQINLKIEQLSTKVQNGTYSYTKTQEDTLLGAKVDTDTFQTAVSGLQNAIDTKAVASEVETALAAKLNSVDYAADMANIYNKTEVDTLVTNGFVATDTFTTFSTNVANTYETKEDHASDVSTINAAIAAKVDSSTYETAIGNVYTKSETYTKAEVDEAINAAIASILEEISRQFSGNNNEDDEG